MLVEPKREAEGGERAQSAQQEVSLAQERKKWERMGREKNGDAGRSDLSAKKEIRTGVVESESVARDPELEFAVPLVDDATHGGKGMEGNPRVNDRKQKLRQGQSFHYDKRGPPTGNPEPEVDLARRGSRAIGSTARDVSGNKQNVKVPRNQKGTEMVKSASVQLLL